MKLEQIKLKNIGSYFGRDNIVDLQTEHSKNVILIGGNNGAGKTTFLESLRVALFGSYAYGYMSESEAYFQKIFKILNRRAVELGETEYQIKISFTSIEQFTPILYEFERTWQLQNQKLKEYFVVRKAGVMLSERESDQLQNRIREEFPPKLFELCLFDGEEISRVVSDDKIPEYLSEIARVLFNLDLFINLEKDLQNYKFIRTAAEDHDEDTQTYNSLQSNLEELQTQKTQLENEQIELQDQSLQLKERQNQLRRDFDRHGGLMKEQRQILLQQINEIEQSRKVNSEKIRELLLTLMPVLLCKDLLQSVDWQMEAEKENEWFEQFCIKINPQTLQTVCNDDQEANQLFEKLSELVSPVQSSVIHRASFAQRSEIRQLNQNVQALNEQSYLTLFEENQKLLEKLQVLRQKLDVHDQSSEFKDMLAEIEENSHLLEQKKLLSEQNEIQITDLSQNIFQVQTELNKVYERLRNLKKSDQSFLIADKLLKVSERFRQMQIRKKLDLVERQATMMLGKLLRKKGYITQIRINHETFEVTTYQHQKELAKDRLSAGEKEILMLSILWAMFKSTGWRLPLVFDTLLGRLDQTHKRELIEKFIPDCGEQVVILATDSEITAAQWEMILPIVHTCYTFEFDLTNEKTLITKNQYFQFSLHEQELAN